MFKKTKWMIIYLCFVLAFSSMYVPVFAQDSGIDDVSGHWAEKSLRQWINNGILIGYPDRTIKPDQKITTAELIGLINRVFGFKAKSDRNFKDVLDSKWYADEFLKAKAAEYFTGYGDLAKPDEYATRAEAVVMLYSAFDFYDPGNIALNFSDLAQIPEYAQQAVRNMAGHGYISGYPDHSFRPEGFITRSEMISILDRIVDYLYNTQGEFTSSEIKGNAVINHKGVILKNTMIDGNLYLAPGIGEGDVTLNNVTVKGKTVLAGGGANTVKIQDSALSEVIVDKANGQVRLLVSGKTNIGQTVIRSGVILEEDELDSGYEGLGNVEVSEHVVHDQAVTFSGDFEQLNVNTNAPIIINRGTIQKIRLQTTSNVTINKDAVVTEIAINEDASNVVITCEGEIKQIVVNADGVTINGRTVDRGTQVQVINGMVVSIASGRSSFDSSPSAPSGQQTQIIAEYTFDSDIQGWTNSGTYQAAFGSPDLEFSNDLDNGALKMNAVLTDTSVNWQELKIGREVDGIGDATKVSFELYLDLSVLDLNAYGDIKIQPYLAFDPGWLKVGEGVNSSLLNDLEAVTIKGKQYAKFEVTNIPLGIEDKTKLNMNIVFSGLSYVGPIYIDNVRITKGPIGNPNQEPGVQPDSNQPVISTQAFDLSDQNLVDMNATNRTKSLFAYLKNMEGKSILFGQEHATTQGLTISKKDGTESDVNNAVGAFPAIYGWDTLSLTGNEEPGSLSNTALQNEANLANVMRLAYERGGLITLSAHMPNFVTGGDYQSESHRVVEQILPGGTKNEEYKQFLDMVADFANNELKDSHGNSIPLIFRPFHEANGTWFWWGASNTTREEYISIYRYTVEYLRDVKNVHNFLYAYSPNGTFGGLETDYLHLYPGDDYVDILGYDLYDSNYNQAWKDALAQDAAMIVGLAEDKGKIAALTEVGMRDLKISGNPELHWWTNVLNTLKADAKASKVAYLATWRNGSFDEMYVPYRNHPIFGNNELLDDFITFYNDSHTAFNDRLQGVYDLSVEASEEAPSMYILTPTQYQVIHSPQAAIRAGVFHKPVDHVTVKSAATDETQLFFNPATGYYEGLWKPAASENGQVVELTVKAYYQDHSTDERTVTVKVYTSMLLQSFEFDQDNADASFEGFYTGAGSASGAVVHSSTVGNGAIQLNAEVTDDADHTNWTYQELKVKIPIPSVTQTVYMPDVNELKYDMILPDTAPDSLFKPYAMFYRPEAPGYVKIGEGETQIKLSDFSDMTVSGAVYKKYTVDIPFTSEPTATDLVLGIVSNDWNYHGPIYIDNVQMLNTQHEPLADPYLVDDFEGYLGNSSVLAAKFSKNGDPSSVNLTQTEVGSGDYAMKFMYTLAGNGYSGEIRALNGVDWSAKGKLHYWIKPDGKGQKLVLQIKANGVEYEYYSTLSDTNASVEEIPFNEFKAKGSGNPLNATALKKVNQFAIYVNAVGGAALTDSILLFDDIKAVGTASDEGGDTVGYPDGVLYDFENSLDGWVMKSGADNLQSVQGEGTANGEYALKADITLGDEQKFELAHEGDMDLSSNSIIKVRVKRSESGVFDSPMSAKLYIKTGSGWTWSDSGSVDINSTGYTEITFDIGSVADRGATKAVGVEFFSPQGSTGDCSVYIDYLTAE